MADEEKKPKEVDVDKNDKLVYERIMSSENGRTLMRRHLNEAGVFHDTFHTDPYMNAHNCGLRAYGLKLQDELLYHVPARYLTMMKEATDD
jgi:hypothetical protein